MLGSLKDELAETRPPVPKNYAIRFVDNFRRTIEKNVIEHWLVLPIHRARLKNLIEFGNYMFIPGHLPRNEKIRT